MERIIAQNANRGNMIRIFYGDDRKRAQEEIKKLLDAKYEVLEGVSIKPEDMPSIFFGGSLFAEKRAILIKDMGENKEIFEKLKDFLGTENDVIVWESKLDKRTAAVKDLAKTGVEMKEFKTEVVDDKVALEIFNVALRDGKKAVEMVEKIELTQNPYSFLGLLISQALKRYEWKQGSKEKRVLMELSKLDIQMKSTTFSQWMLLKKFLLQVSSW